MTTPCQTPREISGVILAGGRAERLGGIDKGLLRVQGRPLIEYALDVMIPRVGECFISANRSASTYAQYGHPVLPDEDFPLAGPLAGIHEAMKRMQGEWLLVLPCDAFGLTGALLDRLLSARAPGIPALVAEDGERWHPTFSLIHRSQHDALREWLAGGERRFGPWMRSIGVSPVDCSDHPEWFRNLNRPEDVRAAEGTGR